MVWVVDSSGDGLVLQEGALKIALGTFASWALRERLGTDPVGGVEAALLYYAERARTSRAELLRPDLYRDLGRKPQGITFEVDPSPAVEGVLRCEAKRFEVPIERVVTHAVLLYLADLDAASEAAQGTRLPPSLDAGGGTAGEAPASPTG
jgi:hypothetical protein